MNISVIGLGKLGLCTAACFAAAGHKVFGFDSDEACAAMLKRKECPLEETGLPELLGSAWASLTIVDSYAEAVGRSDTTFIIVPTPSMENGRFSNEHVIGALKKVAPAVASKDDFHLVSVVSTVMPGSSDELFIPLLEELTGKKCGIDFGVAYNPEFIALGSVIRDFLNPDLVLIGASDRRSVEVLSALYQSTCKSEPAICAMSLINAEITKISLNCYVTMKISYANALCELCERVPGADIDVVTAAIGADSRVGRKYLTGGLGFGGPCFPRDNIAFQSFAQEWGTSAVLGNSVVAINHGIPGRLFRRLGSCVAPPAKVSLLGLSYKANTSVIEESQPVTLTKMLVEAGYRVTVHDPKAIDAARRQLGDTARYASDPYEAVAEASAIVLLTDWPEYRSLDWQRIGALASPGAAVIDCWRIARDRDMSRFSYLPLGIAISHKEGPWKQAPLSEK